MYPSTDGLDWIYIQLDQYLISSVIITMADYIMEEIEMLSSQQVDSQGDGYHDYEIGMLSQYIFSR